MKPCVTSRCRSTALPFHGRDIQASRRAEIPVDCNTCTHVNCSLKTARQMQRMAKGRTRNTAFVRRLSPPWHEPRAKSTLHVICLKKQQQQSRTSNSDARGKRRRQQREREEVGGRRGLCWAVGARGGRRSDTLPGAKAQRAREAGEGRSAPREPGPGLPRGREERRSSHLVAVVLRLVLRRAPPREPLSRLRCAPAAESHRRRTTH